MSWDYIVTVPEFTGDKEAKIFRKPQTNADLVKNMSADEIVNWYFWVQKYLSGYTDSKLALLDWLKRECVE